MSRSRRVLTKTSTMEKTFTVEESLTSLEKDISSGSSPLSAIRDNIAAIFPKCRKLKDASHAMRLHACMQESGLESDGSFGNQLVSLLADVGRLSNAQQVFKVLNRRTEFSWTSLISGYIKHGKFQQALTLYDKMQDDSIQASGYTFVALLKACSKLKDVERGCLLHTDVRKQGLERDVFVGSALVDMYAKLGMLEKAEEVFENLLVRDAMSWNALISGFANHGCCEEALECYERMQSQGITPTIVTFVCSLKACGSLGVIDKGREIHVEVARRGLDGDLVVANTLVDMYGNIGLLGKAQEVFDKIPARDVVSWTALIAGYVKHGQGEEALHCFEQMQMQGVSPDVVTLVCVLKACGMTKSLDMGKEIHGEIERDGANEGNPLIGNALVDMYAKCGLLVKAQDIFDKLTVREATTWNALLTGYVKQGLSEEALICFEQMCCERVPPDAITLSCLMKACGSLGATDKAEKIYAEVSTRGLLCTDPVVGNGVVDMYVKCGLLGKAQEAFDKLPVQDMVSWNSLIAGYAQVGEMDSVFTVLQKMVLEGEKPNAITFGSILNAFIHGGLVFQGESYYETIFKEYDVTPTPELHACMIDLFSRAGQLHKAVLMVKEMPIHPTLLVWNTVLGACRKWGNVELGKQAFEHAVGVDGKDAAAYVCMGNIYADADMLEQAKKIEVLRITRQAWQVCGESCGLM